MVNNLGNPESQKGVIWKIKWKIKECAKFVKNNINNALDREKIKDEWKQNIVKEFRMLSPEEKKKVKDYLLTYFKQENVDSDLFYLPNGKRVDTVNHHVFGPDTAKMDAIIDQIHPYFKNVDWSDKNLNRTIFDFLEEFGIQVRPSISPLGSRIW